MNPAFWLLASGFLLAVVVIVCIHKLGSHLKVDGPEKTKDRIWALERVFFGAAIGIILLSHAKDIFNLFQGEHPSDDMVKSISVTLLALAASGVLLLLARLVDAILGDE